MPSRNKLPVVRQWDKIGGRVLETISELVGTPVNMPLWLALVLAVGGVLIGWGTCYAAMEIGGRYPNPQKWERRQVPADKPEPSLRAALERKVAETGMVAAENEATKALTRVVTPPVTKPSLRRRRPSNTVVRRSTTVVSVKGNK